MDAVHTLKSLVKKSSPTARSTNFVFDLHTTYTVWILLIAFLIGLKDYFGPTINCGSNSYINDYCYIQNTYTVASLNYEQVYENVGPDPSGTEKTYHAYYKWLHLVYLCMALLAHSPRLIWKNFEGGYLNIITSGLLNAKKIKSEQKKEIVEFLLETYEDLKYYAWKLFTCEVLNTIFAFIQITVLNQLIGGSFFGGFEIITKSFWESADPATPMHILFPKVSKW
jgi:hypothetical protein